MAEKTKGGAYTIEISLHPPAATRMMNSDMMLMLMSHIAKCVITVIKVSVELYQYPVVIRSRGHSEGLLSCGISCFSASTLSLLAASVIYLAISSTNVCIFLWWLFLPASPYCCSSSHHQSSHHIVLNTSFYCQLLAGSCLSYLENQAGNREVKIEK